MDRSLDPIEGFARYAKEYDDKEKFWDSFEKNQLLPYFRMAKGKKVLDAGAGTGRLTKRLRENDADVTALDISPDMLRILKQKLHDVEIVEADMEEMPFEDKTFDMVFSSLALVHLKDIVPFMDECYRVLKDDGLFVLTNIHYRNAMTLRDQKGTYSIACYNHYPRHVKEAAEKLAFGIVDEIILYEGDDIWITQILILKK